MRTLCDIDNEITRWTNEKYRYTHCFVRPRYTNISSIIKDLYIVRNIIENNNINDAIKIITDKRQKLVDRKKKYDSKFDILTLYDIRDEIRNTIQLYNWILGKDEFDYE